MSTNPALTPELEALIAKQIMENKPYLLEVEEQVHALGGYGTLDVRLDIRGGVVEKVTFYSGRVWMKPKTIDPTSKK